MKKRFKSQHGSLLIEVALALIVLGAIGGAIYTSQQAKRSQVAVKSSTTESESSAATEYKGWKSYTSRDEGLTFKYPSDWRIEVTSDGLYDKAILTSPNGMALRYMADVSGLGGGCMSPECPDVATYKLEKIADTNSPTDLYYVEGSIKSNANGDKLKNLYVPRMGIISKTEGTELPKIGEELDRYPYYIFAQKRKKPTGEFKSNLFGLFFEIYPTQESDALKWGFDSKAKVQQFLNSKDAQTAKLIFKSTKY